MKNGGRTRDGGARTVLMLLPQNHFRAQEGLNAVRAEAAARRWNFFSAEVFRSPGGAPRLARASRPADSLRDLFATLRPDGMIVWRWALSSGELRAAGSGDVPLVFVHRPPAGDPPDDGRFAFVCWDSAAIASHAARALLLSGFGVFAYVSPAVDSAWSRERLDAFRRCIEVAGRRFRAFGPPSGRDAFHRAEALRRWLEALPKPCGVFTANDTVGEEVLSACASTGLRVPDDVAVVGEGDAAHVCEATVPTLSSVALDRRAEGRVAAELLDDWMRHPGRRPPARTIPVRGIVLRASSRFSRDRRVSAALESIRLHACEAAFDPGAVARSMGVSRALADRLFRSAAGRTILGEIHAVRLSRAKERLRDGEPPAVVAAECGYSSPDVFRHVFRDRVGTTVRKWLLDNRI